MKNYYKVTFERKNRSKYADECVNGSFVGINGGIHSDLSNELTEDWREFNHKFIPIYLTDNPDKSKIAAGLACRSLWTIWKEISKGDILVCPNGRGVLLFGEVTGDYSYNPDAVLPDRRTVQWLSTTIKRSEVSEQLNKSIKLPGTLGLITEHSEEIERYIAGNKISITEATHETIEDLSVFALEKHLEDFLVQNWKQTELGKQYDIYEEEGELVGQQYPTDTGPIDILAIRKDKEEILVVELKKGRASDSVVGQIQRYMGYVQEELAEENQVVKGAIIALEDDIRIRRALSVARNIEFYRYQVSFKLFKG